MTSGLMMRPSQYQQLLCCLDTQSLCLSVSVATQPSRPALPYSAGEKNRSDLVVATLLYCDCDTDRQRYRQNGRPEKTVSAETAAGLVTPTLSLSLSLSLRYRDQIRSDLSDTNTLKSTSSQAPPGPRVQERIQRVAREELEGAGPLW